jgi:polyhydroxybutyrate depolymerase
MRWSPRRRGLVATMAAIAVLAGCGGGERAGGSADTTSSATTAPQTRTSLATTSARPKALGPRDHRLRLRVGSERRSLLLHTPPGWNRSQRLPLVIALHMMRDGANGKTIRDLTGLDATADRERFLVAYPDGLDGQWNAILCCNPTDDVGFIRALVTHAQRRWGADPDRVYATGASNGAAMSYRRPPPCLACSRPSPQ